MKKLLSILLIVCILATACSITASASNTTRGTFLLQVMNDLENVYYYATDSEGNQLNGDFPGEKAYPTVVREWFGRYEYDYYWVKPPENTAYIIISDNNGRQTEILDKDFFELDLPGVGEFGTYVPYNSQKVEVGRLYESGDKTSESGSTRIGDINADKTVDVFDAVVIQKFSVEDPELNEVQKKVADFNFDGIVDVLDAAAIQKAVVD